MKNLIEVMKPMKVVNYTVCNKCGKSDSYSKLEMFPIQIVFGFYSKNNGKIWEFDLCEDCLNELVDAFTHEQDVIVVDDSTEYGEE